MKISRAKAWLTVLGGFCIHIVLGTLYLWANISSAVTSYLRKYDPSITYNDTILVFAASLLAQGITMMLGGMISQRLGARASCMMGGTVIVVGAMGASFCTSLTALCFCQGIMFGLGLGLSYTAPITAAVHHLPEKKGLVSGIIVGGFGSGAFVFGYLASHLVNPHSESLPPSSSAHSYYAADSYVVKHVPYMYQMLSLTYAMLLLLGVGCMTDKQEGGAEGAEGEEEREGEGEGGNGVKRKGKVIRLSHSGSISNPLNDYQSLGETEMVSMMGKGEDAEEGGKELQGKREVQTGRSYVIEIGEDDEAVLSPIPMSLLADQYAKLPTHSSHHINDSSNADHTSLAGEEEASSTHPSHSLSTVSYSTSELLFLPLTYLVMSCFICSTVGGMYLAGTFKTYAAQYFSSEHYLVSISACSSLFNCMGRLVWGQLSDLIGTTQTLLLLCAIFASIILTYPLVTHSYALFAAWTFLMFFCEGGNFVLYIPITLTLFGEEYGASNYGLIFSSYSLFVVLSITGMSRFDVSFTVACQLMGALTALSVGLVSLLHYEVKKLKKRDEYGSCKQT